MAQEGHYHLSVKIISRGKGQAATASAAYRSGEKITDEQLGKTFDYTRKQSIYQAELIAPDNAPDWMKNRSQLWNAIEKKEKRFDAQLAREIELSIPKELTHQQKTELVRKFVKQEFVSRGMIADITYHNFTGQDSHNPHAHILLTMRKIKGDNFGDKCLEWNRKELLKQWRSAWANHNNRALQQAGLDMQVDHRSFKERGIEDRAPINESMQVAQMRKKAEKHPLRYPMPDKAKQNNELKKLNRELADLKRQLAKEEEKQKREQQERKPQQITPKVKESSPTIPEPQPTQAAQELTEDQRELLKFWQEYRERERGSQPNKDKKERDWEPER
jgi:ATP-dependent exoDNAse (exonuclease V) alpha subunit